MSNSKLPTEVELVYEVMPCRAMRTDQEPTGTTHPCAYFNQWGTYHSFDYSEDGPPAGGDILRDSVYVGRARLLPEILSGCRKSPIMAVGINPNLPGWYPGRRGSLNPLFDSYKQYAHYFRYRSTAKLELSREDYQAFGGNNADTPFSDFGLNVPLDAQGKATISPRLQRQTMYTTYQGLLDDLAKAMGWPEDKLVVGEDLSYSNMVACPSARWTTRPLPDDPQVPPMTLPQRNGIVSECFRERKHFLRQLFQSLPRVILVFSQNTASAFVNELRSNLIGQIGNDPRVADLMNEEIRLKFADLPNGETLSARVIFSPHITGDPGNFNQARQRVVDQLVEEAQHGNLRYEEALGHLSRPVGSCVFCTMLQIGPCDYANRLTPLPIADIPAPGMLAAGVDGDLIAEKKLQEEMVSRVTPALAGIDVGWTGTDEEGSRIDV